MPGRSVTNYNMTNTTADNPVGSWDNHINLPDLLLAIVRRKNLIVAVVTSVMVIVSVVLLLLPNRFISMATILPSGKARSGLSELRDLTGLAGLTLADDNSSTLYPDILRSQTIYDAVLKGQYTFVHKGESKSLSLPEYFAQDDPDKLRQALDAITTIDQNRKTGVIRIGVETDYPGLSQVILRQYLSELESFNLHKRRSTARDKSVYLAKRLSEHGERLAESEDLLEQFQAVNRNWAATTNPEILKELGRLQRDVEVNSGIYMLLRKEYEVAALDAQKDVPIVRILDNPSLPTQKSGPYRTLYVLLSGMVSLVIILMIIVTAQARNNIHIGPRGDEFRLFENEVAQAFPRSARTLSFISRKTKLVRSEERETVRT